MITGKTIKTLRKQAGMTQAGLSEASGIGQSHISRVERDQARLSLSGLVSVARALGVTLEALVSD